MNDDAVRPYLPLDMSRGWSDMLTATFTVLRQVVMPAVKAASRITLPFIIVWGGAVVAIGMQGLEFVRYMTAATSPFGPFGFLGYVLWYLLLMPPVMYMWNTMVVAVLQYHALQRIPTVQEIRSACKGTWGVACVTFFINTFVGAIVMNVTRNLVVLHLDHSVVKVLLVLGIMFSVGMLMTLFMMTLVIRHAEKVSYRAALRRFFMLNNGRMLDTVGCAAITTIIPIFINLASYMIIIVGMAMFNTGADYDDAMAVSAGALIGVVGAALCVVAFHASIACCATFNVVLYFSRKEWQEGSGLWERIDTIGARESDP